MRKASDASYVEGATVDIMADKEVLRSMVTPASGKFQFRIAGGEYVVRIHNVAGLEGLDYTETVEVHDSRTEHRTFAVARPLGPGKLRMVLTWGEEPKDLDSHLLTSTGCNVFYGHKQCPDGSASLDADVTDGFGPETINVHTLRPGLYKCGARGGRGCCVLTPRQVQSARVQQRRHGGKRRGGQCSRSQRRAA